MLDFYKPYAPGLFFPLPLLFDFALDLAFTLGAGVSLPTAEAPLDAGLIPLRHPGLTGWRVLEGMHIYIYIYI